MLVNLRQLNRTSKSCCRQGQAVSLLKVVVGMLSLSITAFLGQFPQNSVICLITHLFREHPKVPGTTQVHEVISVALGSSTTICLRASQLLRCPCLSGARGVHAGACKHICLETKPFTPGFDRTTLSLV